MFINDEYWALVCAKGRDEVAAAVAKIPEEDLRSTLMHVIMHYQKTFKLEHMLWNNENDKYTALKTELAEAKKRIQELENNQ